MYYLQDNQVFNSSLRSGATGSNGACNINFDVVPGTPAVAIFVVDYRGMRVPKVFVLSESSIQRACLVGQKLSLSVSSRMIDEVIAPIKDGKCEICNVSFRLEVGGDGFTDVDYVEPGTIIALTVAGDKLLVAQRFMDRVEYGTVSLSSSSLPLGFMLEKMVSVEGFSYIVRFYVWRLVW
jgi:hypothetical protein